MEKAIIILNGVGDGKTKFVDTIKQNGYWVWNLNHKNVLSMVAHKIGWDGNRNPSYYEFLDEFKNLSNKYFDFESWYMNTMIEKFKNNSKANVLVIHNCDDEISKSLQGTEFNAYSIYISEKEEKEDSSYCKTLNYREANYENNVLQTIEILTK